jgi:hypothetical protein
MNHKIKNKSDRTDNQDELSVSVSHGIWFSGISDYDPISKTEPSRSRMLRAALTYKLMRSAFLRFVLEQV